MLWPGATSVKSRLFSSELSLKRLGWSKTLDSFIAGIVKKIKGLTSERPSDKSKSSHKGAKKSSRSRPLQTWCWMMKTKKKGYVLQWIFHCPFDNCSFQGFCPMMCPWIWHAAHLRLLRLLSDFHWSDWRSSWLLLFCFFSLNWRSSLVWSLGASLVNGHNDLVWW